MRRITTASRFSCLVVAAVGQVACAGRPVVLARQGTAACTIVLPADALDLEKKAALELADHLEKVIGDRPTVADQPGTGPNIHVGRTPAIERLLPDVDFDALGTDGIVMRTVGRDLVLTGGRPRGVLFCVYTFLQDVVGVRWWAPDQTHVPSEPSLAVTDLDVTYRPPFDIRQFVTGAFNDMTFATRMRLNGGILGLQYADHSITHLLPPKEHFLEHPEWFMYTPPGDVNESYGGEYSYDTLLARMKTAYPKSWYDVAVRTRRLPYQPCSSSPGAIEAVTSAVRKKLAAEYPKWKFPPRIVVVSQSNGAAECRCDACRATHEREGSASASWVGFVNAIAERIEKDYPDVQVTMMAFLHLEKPPAHLRPHPNVSVFSVPVTSDRKRPLRDVVEGQWTARWCAITSRVYIWEHEANFWNPIQPHPNHFVIPDNVRFFAEHGVKGVMLEGKGGQASEFRRMRAWVHARLLWDPHQDARKLMNEFLDAYYGEAGPFLMKWIELQQDAARRADDHVQGAYTMYTDGWLRVEDLNRGMGLFDQALAAVEADATLERRVRRERLNLEMVWIQSYDKLKAEAAERGQPFLGPEDPLVALERIAKDEFKLAWPYLPHHVERLRKKLKGEPVEERR